MKPAPPDVERHLNLGRVISGRRSLTVDHPIMQG